jgi:hypothetical protein
LRILPLLQFITTTLWGHLFAHPADGLEQSVEHKNEYMIIDNTPLVSEYISVPKDAGDFNPNAFVAGIIEGVCDYAGFTTVGKRGVGVSAHWSDEGEWKGRTVFLVKFGAEVMEREEALGRGDK